MAKKSNNFTAAARVLFACLAIATALGARMAAGCPFCKPLEPTWSQSLAGAAFAALAEVEREAAQGATKLKVHRIFVAPKAAAQSSHLTLPLDLAASPGTLVLVFGTGPRNAALQALSWYGVAVNETSYAYFGRSPAAPAKAAERLNYFAHFLEHADAAIAEDAYLEFAHASFDDVVAVAESLPSDPIRAWLVDPAIPPHRKGFYGLALGLARDPNQRHANAELLRKLVLDPQDDFRSGFDGILGGYLLLEGPRALELIDKRYLANPQAADGDVRHALSALRFYSEYGREIPAEQVHAALRHLLARPEFAEAAVIDLARGKDWGAVDEIARLYAQPQYAQSAIRRAIVGYLLASPDARAAAALKRLRDSDPQGVAEAEQVLSRIGSVPATQ